MKTKTLSIVLFIGLVVSACGSKSESFTEYKCPMNCENKTYDKAGTCPVCKMDLEGVETKK